MNFTDVNLSALLNKSRETDTEIRNEQVAIAYQQMPLSLLTLVISSIVLAAVQWGVIDHFVILLWLVFQLGIVGWRIYLYRIFTHDFSDLTAEAMEKSFIRGLVVSSAVFGSSSLLLFPAGNIPHQVFLSFILAGMSAGAITTLSPIRRASALFLSFTLLPLVIILVLESSTLHYVMASMVLLFWIMLQVISKRFYDNLYKTIQSSILYKHALKVLQSTEERFETIFKEAPAGIFYYDNNAIVLDCNHEMTRSLQIDKESFVGLDLRTISDRRIIDAVESVFDGERGFYEGPYHTTLSGIDLHIVLRTSPIYDEHRNIIGGIGIAADITERKNFENIIRHLAHHDSLTDIPNRLLLMERIEQSVIRYNRHGIQVALMFIDLDRFKTINDSLGHHIGDELLIDVAKRIRHTIRDEDTVARLGGDEFVVLIADLETDMQNATMTVEHIAEKIHDALSKPFYLKDGQTLNVTSSIGIAFVNHRDEVANDLLKHADAAMYRAKQDGRNTTRFYQENMDEWIKKRLFLEGELRNAIGNNELELYYQPVIEVETKTMIGAEALLRWNHPKLGLVMPDDMISIAEESGLIIPIGEWVLYTACRQCVEWKNSHTHGEQIDKIAVNVSALQFKQLNFVSVVKKVLEETRIDPYLLEIELTESIIVDNLELTIEKMNELRALGIRISMDDFGTGYSSLSYLKRLPFTTLKIDRSFVRDIMSDSDDAAMVQMMISMASIFNMDVIAEGVEEVAQYTFLHAHGCKYFQGYLCSKPVQAARFEALLSGGIQQC